MIDVFNLEVLDYKAIGVNSTGNLDNTNVLMIQGYLAVVIGRLVTEKSFVTSAVKR